jgi:AcrR family transcriptional regulator
LPKQIDVNQRRNQIAFATWAVIAARGIQEVSLRHVAQEAGMSVGAVQHHFRSKKALLLYSCQLMGDMAGQQGASPPGHTARRQMRRVTRTILNDNPNQPTGMAAWTAFISYAFVDPDIATIVHNVWIRARKDFATLVSQAAREENITLSDSPNHIAETYFNLLDGLCSRVLAGHLSFAQANRLADGYLKVAIGVGVPAP